MKTIYKYPLEPLHHQILPLPQGAAILAVGSQRRMVCLWAVVDPEEPPVDHQIYLVETGSDLTEKQLESHYYGTVQFVGGSYILHAFGTAPRYVSGEPK